MALANAYYTNIFRSTSTQVSEDSSPEINYTVNEEGENSEKALKVFAMSQSSSISSPSSTNSSGYKNNLRLEDTHSVLNFKNGYKNCVHGAETSGPFLNFEQNEQSPQTLSPKTSHQDEYPFWEDLNCVQSSSNSYGFIDNKETPHGIDIPFGWTSSETNGTNKELQARDLASVNKRPLLGESTQALKRQCNTSATKKQPKPKSTPSKDPQSVAAKNRRERISERLKVLQELVPNGSKVDLVTMLEKAIGYVKFLQLQVKVLAADEFWPAQGGRAPDLMQVKEALDAILSTQRDRSSSSK